MSESGIGQLKRVTIANPAAGSELSVTVPAGRVWKLLSFTAQLVTSAVVAAREPSLVFDDGTTIFFRSANIGSQAASQTRNYSYFQGAGFASGMARHYTNALPAPAIALPAGYRIRTDTFLFDVGDDWSAAELLVVEFTSLFEALKSGV